jgi:hypothetical protein
MGRMKFRAINYKGKREYVWDPKGKYVRHDNKFVLESKLPGVDEKELILKNEFLKLTKGKPFIKKRVKHIKNVEKKIYYAKVWMITEANDLTVLKNHNKRGFKKYHLDHIYSISEGFKNSIPPELIGNIKNLRFIHHKKNIKKGAEINEEGEKIIKQLLEIYEKNN